MSVDYNELYHEFLLLTSSSSASDASSSHSQTPSPEAPSPSPPPSSAPQPPNHNKPQQVMNSIQMSPIVSASTMESSGPGTSVSPRSSVGVSASGAASTSTQLQQQAPVADQVSVVSVNSSCLWQQQASHGSVLTGEKRKEGQSQGQSVLSMAMTTSTSSGGSATPPNSPAEPPTKKQAIVIGDDQQHVEALDTLPSPGQSHGHALTPTPMDMHDSHIRHGGVIPFSAPTMISAPGLPSISNSKVQTTPSHTCHNSQSHFNRSNQQNTNANSNPNQPHHHALEQQQQQHPPTMEDSEGTPCIIQQKHVLHAPHNELRRLLTATNQAPINRGPLHMQNRPFHHQQPNHANGYVNSNDLHNQINNLHSADDPSNPIFWNHSNNPQLHNNQSTSEDENNLTSGSPPRDRDQTLAMVLQTDEVKYMVPWMGDPPMYPGGLDVVWKETPAECQRLLSPQDVPVSARDRGYFTVSELLTLKRCLVSRFNALKCDPQTAPNKDNPDTGLHLDHLQQQQLQQQQHPPSAAAIEAAAAAAQAAEIERIHVGVGGVVRKALDTLDDHQQQTTGHATPNVNVHGVMGHVGGSSQVIMHTSTTVQATASSSPLQLGLGSHVGNSSGGDHGLGQLPMTGPAMYHHHHQPHSHAQQSQGLAQGPSHGQGQVQGERELMNIVPEMKHIVVPPPPYRTANLVFKLLQIGNYTFRTFSENNPNRLRVLYNTQKITYECQLPMVPPNQDSLQHLRKILTIDIGFEQISQMQFGNDTMYLRVDGAPVLNVSYSPSNEEPSSSPPALSADDQNLLEQIENGKLRLSPHHKLFLLNERLVHSLECQFREHPRFRHLLHRLHQHHHHHVTCS